MCERMARLYLSQSVRQGWKLVASRVRLQSLEFDPQRCAVTVVDMQNDFGSPGGMFDLGGNNISLIRETVAPTARVIEAARKAGARIVYLKMGFQPDLSDAGEPGTPNRLMHD